MVPWYSGGFDFPALNLLPERTEHGVVPSRHQTAPFPSFVVRPACRLRVGGCGRLSCRMACVPVLACAGRACVLALERDSYRQEFFASTAPDAPTACRWHAWSGFRGDAATAFGRSASWRSGLALDLRFLLAASGRTTRQRRSAPLRRAHAVARQRRRKRIAPPASLAATAKRCGFGIVKEECVKK